MAESCRKRITADISTIAKNKKDKSRPALIFFNPALNPLLFKNAAMPA